MSQKKLLKPIGYRCKIGTIPSFVYLCRNYKLSVGTEIFVRDAIHGSKPFRIVIDRVNDDGYFFARRV